MSKHNSKLPRTPQIWVNGYRYPFRPECSECGLIADEPSPNGWDYVEINPDDGWGYICPHCQES